MTTPPASDEIAGALGRFFHGGIGPSHATLTGVFLRAGYSDADPYVEADGVPNKEVRVQTVVRAAARRPTGARQLADGLFTALRIHGCFNKTKAAYNPDALSTAQSAFRRGGWSLSVDGLLSILGHIDLHTGGREALDEQIDRLRRASEDPGQLLGSAKDLLEAVAKFVLEELGCPQDGDFGHLWFLARDRLGIHPTQVAYDSPGAAQVKKILVPVGLSQSRLTSCETSKELATVGRCRLVLHLRWPLWWCGRRARSHSSHSRLSIAF